MCRHFLCKLVHCCIVTRLWLGFLCLSLRIHLKGQIIRIRYLIRMSKALAKRSNIVGQTSEICFSKKLFDRMAKSPNAFLESNFNESIYYGSFLPFFYSTILQYLSDNFKAILKIIVVPEGTLCPSLPPWIRAGGAVAPFPPPGRPCKM